MKPPFTRAARVKYIVTIIEVFKANVLFFGFDIWPKPIFLCRQILELFFFVSQNFRYSFGSDKFLAIFGGFPIFLSDT